MGYWTRSRRRRHWGACAVVVAAVSPLVQGKVQQASWESATSGTWDEGSRWSISPRYPNNGTPNNTDYEVAIAVGGAAYTVTLDSSVTINSLLLNSAAATLDQAAGTLTVNTFNLAGNAYNLRGGTLRNATVSGAGAFYIEPIIGAAGGPTVDHVTLATNATLVGVLPGEVAPLTRVVNGLTLSGGADVNLYSGGLEFSGTQTLAGTGDLLFGGTNASTLRVASGALTIQSGIQLRTISQDANVVVAPGASVLNYGTLSSDAIGRSINVTGAFTNYGIVRAELAGSLRLTSVHNAGTVEVLGNSTLFLDGNWSAAAASSISLQDTARAELAGTFSTDSLLTVSRSAGATLTVTGTVDNTGDTLVLDAVAGGGAWPLYTSADGSRSGKVRGGTVTAVNPTTTGLVIPAVSPSAAHPRAVATFESLTLATHAYVNADATLNLAGDVSLASGRNVAVNTGGTLNLMPGARVLGPGGVLLNTTGSVLCADGPATLGVGSTVMVGMGSSTIQGPATAGEALSLQGTITGHAAGIDTLTIAGNWSNTGTIRANGDKVILAGNTNSLGTLDGRVGSITLAGVYDNTGKTLALSSSTGPLYFGLPTTTRQAGTIKGGTLSNADAQSRFVTLHAPGVQAGTLDGVTLAGSIGTFNSDVHVVNGLTLDNATLSLGAGKLVFAGGTQSLGGSGQITFDGGNGFVASAIQLRNSALTIGPGITARTGNYSGSIDYFDDPNGVASSLFNYGTLSSANSNQLHVGVPTVVNHGTISLTGGSFGSFRNLDNRGTFMFVAGGPNRRLQIYGDWSNTGTFTAHDAQLTLGGTFSTATLLSLQRTGTGGWLEVLGNIDNAGATLAFDSFAGAWPFYPLNFNASAVTGSVTGGTITAINPAGLTAVGNDFHAGTFDNLTLDADVALAGNLEFRRTITLPAGRTVRTTNNSSSGLTLNNGQLVGGGEVLLDSAASVITAVGTTNNVIGPGVTVRTGPNFSSAIVGNFAKLSAGLTNQGVIANDRPGSALTVAGAINNQGTLRVSGGGVMRIVGTVENLGTLQNLGGTFEFSAAYNNTGKTLALDDSTGSLLLYHSTSAGGGPIGGGTTVARFTGGTLATSGSAVFRLAPMTKDGGLGYFGPTAEFDGVTLAGRVDVDTRGHLRIYNGITLDGAVINLANDDLTAQTYGTNVYLPWTSPFVAGNGTFRFTGTGALGPSANRIGFDATNTTLDAGVAIVTATTSGSVYSSHGVTNNGTLAAEAFGKTLLVEAFPFVNSGTLRASNGGTLHLRGNWSGGGSIVVDGGHVLLDGSLAGPALSNIQRTAAAGGSITLAGIVNNGGNTIALSDETGPLFINGTIIGGKITTSGSGYLEAVGNATLTSVAIAGNVNVAPGVRLTVSAPSSPAGAGTITLNNSVLEVRGVPADLNGPLDVILNGDPNGAVNDIISPFDPMTIGAGVTIRTGTNDGRVGFNNPFTNYGTLLSNLPGGVLEVHRPTNHGLVRATNGGHASVANFTNAAGGVISADAGGTLVLSANGSNSFSNAGSITADGSTITVASGTWTNSGTLSVANGSAASLAGSWTNTGSVVAASGSTLSLAGVWSNAGTISVTDSTLVLNNKIPASLGELSAVRSTVRLASTLTTPQVLPFAVGGNNLVLSAGGTIDNTGHTLDIATLAISMSAGSQLRGGTVTSSAASPTPIAATGGSLSDLTLDVPLNVAATSTHNFPTSFFGTQNTAFARPVSITGSGPNSRVAFNGAWSNSSTVTVNSASLSLPATGSNGETLVLNDTSLTFASFASLGNVQRTGGSATFVGTVENAGSTFDPNATSVGTVFLGSGARVNGGTLSSASPVTAIGVGQLTPIIFDAVTLDADLELAGKAGVPGGVTGSTAVTLETHNGLTLANDSQITLLPPASIRITGDQTFSGSGAIVLNGGTLSVGGNFTMGPGITLRSGSTNTTFRWTTVGTSFTNQGLILADSPPLPPSTAGRSFTMFGPFTNQGTVRAVAGNALNLNGLTNISTGGTLTGGTYEVFDGGSITFPVLPGGDLRATITTNNAAILLSGADSTFAPLVPLANNNGSLTLTDGRAFTTAGDLINGGAITLGPSAVLKVVGALTNSGGTIELAGGTLLVDYVGASPVEELMADLRAGRVGTSVLDSAVAYVEASVLGVNEYAGLSVDGTTLLTMVTIAGDANLDGGVGPDDYALLDRSYARAGTGARWTDGDFDYDGAVTGADYLLIDSSFGRQAGGVLGAEFMAMREAQFGAVYVAALATSVPEPSAVALLMGMPLLLNRRRRLR